METATSRRCRITSRLETFVPVTVKYETGVLLNYTARAAFTGSRESDWNRGLQEH